MESEEKSSAQLQAENQQLRKRLVSIQSSGMEHRRNAFQFAPISLWELDCSKAKVELDSLISSGIDDARCYFAENPKAVFKVLRAIDVIDVNSKTLSMYQADSKEQFCASVGKVYTAESLQVFGEVLIRYSEGARQFEAETVNRTLKGKLINTRISVSFPSPDSEFDYVLISLLDITSQKQAEMALVQSEANLRSIFDNIQDTFYRADLGGSITMLSPSVFELMGCSADELLGKKFADYCVEKEGNENFIQELEKAQGNVCGYEAELCRPDGQQRWISTNAHFYRDHDGKIVGVEGVIRDITGYKKSEQALARMVTAMEYAHDAIIISDLDARIEYVNPAFERMTGYSSADAVGQFASIMRSDQHPDGFYINMLETVCDGNVWRGEMTIRCKDGSFCEVERSIAPVFDQQGKINCQITIQRDITEHRVLEERLLQSQKMEAIGTLVGGIAHDFNNILAAIQGNVYLAKVGQPNHPETNRKLDTIEQLGTRAAGMIKQMLTFARKDRVQMKPFPLVSFMKEGFSLAKAAIAENIEHVCEYCDEPLTVYGDVTQLQQALMNLLNNACDAVADVPQPRIACSLASYSADAAFRKRHPDVKGEQFACLTVRDNGCGIPEEELDSIFEPFFTTKDVGAGTGLGLAMVYGAIERHHGAIEVESRPGEGTAFHVYLPLLGAPEAELSVTAEAEQSIVRGAGELVLYAEDEQGLRDVTSKVLTQLGYRLLLASDGEEAVNMFSRDRVNISLVILDIVMPNMGGVDAALQIHAIDSDVPFIFATGYDKNDALNMDDEVLACCPVLRKPFSIKLFSQTIYDCIHEAG